MGQVTRDFAVSRPSVREALAALQFAGHVTSRRGFGTVVLRGRPSPQAQTGAPPARRRRVLRSLTEAVDLLETRLLLEPHALAVAATDPDRQALDAARGLISGMRVAVDEPRLLATSDLLVHRALLAVCRNAVLRESATDLLDLSADPLLLTSRTHAWSSSELPHRWADQHEEVCEAIAAGDADTAHDSSVAHLASVVDNLSAAVTAGGEPVLARRLAAITSRHGVRARTQAQTTMTVQSPSSTPVAQIGPIPTDERPRASHG